MSDVAVKRRRWPYVLFALAVLILAGVFLGGPRRLSPAEQILVGQWRAEDSPGAPDFAMQLTTDRQFCLSPPSGYPLTVGEWRVDGERLVVDQMVVHLTAPPDPTPDQRLRTALHHIVGVFRGQSRGANLWTFVRLESSDSFRAEGGFMIEPTVWRREISPTDP